MAIGKIVSTGLKVFAKPIKQAKTITEIRKIQKVLNKSSFFSEAAISDCIPDEVIKCAFKNLEKLPGKPTESFWRTIIRKCKGLGEFSGGTIPPRIPPMQNRIFEKWFTNAQDKQSAIGELLAILKGKVSKVRSKKALDKFNELVQRAVEADVDKISVKGRYHVAKVQDKLLQDVIDEVVVIPPENVVNSASIFQKMRY